MKLAKAVSAGNVIKIGNDLLLVLKAAFHKSTSGRRASTSEMKFKVRNLITKHTTNISFEAHEKLDVVILERRSCELLYKVDDIFNFMDTTKENVEQFELDTEQLGDNADFLKVSSHVDVMFFENKPISVELPNSMEFTIEYTEPGLRGDTTGKVKKSAILDTGFELQVPIFCNVGDKIKVDTREKEYIERVQN